MARFQTQFVTIPISGKVSGDVSLAGAREIALLVPVITSGTMLVQGSFDTTSALFRRIQNTAGSGDLTLTTAAGSLAFTLPAAIYPFPYLRFEAQNFQTAAVSLAVVTKYAGTGL